MDNQYNRAANITVIVAGIAAASYFFFRYAISAIVPFLIAAVIASAISSPAERIARKTRLSKKVVSAVLVILLFLTVTALLTLAVYRLISEVGNLMEKLTADPETVSNAIDTITAKLSSVGEKFGFLTHGSVSEALNKLGIELDAIIPEALSSLLSSLTSSIPSAAVGIVTKLPETLLFIVVLLLSSYYFCADRDRISTALTSVLPEKWASKLPSLRQKLSETLKGYLKAYLSIMLLTFLEVFLGLTILGVNYAFLISAIVAVVDILPVLGTGTVLIPWAIFSFVSSDPKMGIGLLVLYAVVLIVRQLAEPKIVGNTLGLHPLATLASLYIGIKLLGIAGIFLGPIVAILLSSVFKTTETPAEEEKAQEITP